MSRFFGVLPIYVCQCLGGVVERLCFHSSTPMGSVARVLLHLVWHLEQGALELF